MKNQINQMPSPPLLPMPIQSWLPSHMYRNLKASVVSKSLCCGWPQGFWVHLPLRDPQKNDGKADMQRQIEQIPIPLAAENPSADPSQSQHLFQVSSGS